jgi:hypothetical protein
MSTTIIESFIKSSVAYYVLWAVAQIFGGEIFSHLLLPAGCQQSSVIEEVVYYLCCYYKINPGTSSSGYLVSIEDSPACHLAAYAISFAYWMSW